MLCNIIKKFCSYFILLNFFLVNYSDAQVPIGEFFTIQQNNAYFEVYVTNPIQIKKGRELFASKATIVPFGKVVEGSPDGLNFPYSWHLDPQTVHFAEMGAEIYDGTPYQVEAELKTWITTLGRYGPWGCQIVGIGKRKSVPLPLTFEKFEVGIYPNNNVIAFWNHRGPYSFTKLFGTQKLSSRIPLKTRINVDASYEGSIGGKTIISVKTPSLPRIKRYKSAAGVTNGR